MLRAALRAVFWIASLPPFYLLLLLAVAALRLLDGAVDIVLGHRLAAGGSNREAQARIEGGVGNAELGGNRDFAGELGKHL